MKSLLEFLVSLAFIVTAQVVATIFKADATAGACVGYVFGCTYCAVSDVLLRGDS